MSDIWQTLKQWPELLLERLADAGVARIVLNRPEKRNCWNRPLCKAFIEALEILRSDKELKVVITKGAGPVYSSGLDLNFLREVSNGPLLDWDRPNLTIQIAENLRAFPRIMIAQVHGYCLGGALGIMSCHDLVFAAEDAQLGMPEVLRGSFGQLVTSTLLHSGLPVKKLSLIALGGRNISGKEADALGIVSQSVPAGNLEEHTSQSRAISPRATSRPSSATRSRCRWAETCRSRRPSSSTSLWGTGCAAPWIRSATLKAISSRRRAEPISITAVRMSGISNQESEIGVLADA